MIVNRLLYKVHGGITVRPNESLSLTLHKEVIENGHVLEGLIEDAFKSRLGVVKKRQLALEQFIYYEFIQYHQSYDDVDSLSAKTVSQQRLVLAVSVPESESRSCSQYHL